MSKNINQANSKLNNSNNKLKQSYSNSNSNNRKIMYMPHWLEFYSNSLHSEVNSTHKRYYKAYKKGAIVYARLGSNIGSEFSGNHFCVVLDNNDNRSKETITIVPLSSKKNNNYIKLSTTILDLTTSDLLIQLLNYEESIKQLKEKYNDDDIAPDDSIDVEDKKKLYEFNEKFSEFQTLVNIYSRHAGKDTYANVSAITTISKKRLSKINNSDPTGKISILDDDMDKIHEQLLIKFIEKN